MTRDRTTLLTRARARRRERGAVVFIVAMTLAVLASLGLFALVSASTEVKTAGFERQSLQTHYLAESATLATASMVGPDYAQAVESSMRNNTDYNTSLPRNHCVSLESVPATADGPSKECKILQMTDLTQGWQSPYSIAAGGTPLRASSVSAPGSLGPSALDGFVGVEVTDTIFGEPVSGMATMGQRLTTMCPVTFTVTGYGSTRPNNAGTNDVQKYGAEGVEQSRARLTGGPIPCPQ